jgi:hypothetical protein
MTSSIQTFKEYLFQISDNQPIDPYEEEWNQFVDIENQKFEISFRELPVDKIFRNKRQYVTVDVLESINENETLFDASTNKTNDTSNNKTNDTSNNKTNDTSNNKTTNTSNIYIHNTHYTHNVYNMNKLNDKYLHTEQPPSLVVDNRFYVVIILCAYVSVQFWII